MANKTNKRIDISYIIMVGKDLFLKSLGRSEVDFTKSKKDALSFKYYNDEFEKTNPLDEYIKVQVDSLFKLGFKDIKIIQLKTVVEHTEQEMLFQEITGNKIILIPFSEERFDF